VLALIAATALRRGEALGLRWDQVDLDGGTVKVVATLGEPGGKLTFSEPKTKRSRRTVPIPASVVAMLRSHKRDQAVERLKAGNQWSDDNLVFPTEFGTPTRGNPILRAVKAAAQAIAHHLSPLPRSAAN
jgi:integrase